MNSRDENSYILKGWSIGDKYIKFSGTVKFTRFKNIKLSIKTKFSY